MSDPVPGGEASRILQVDDLRVTVGRDGRWIEAVRGVSFGVEAGEALGIVGESGSGKTLTMSAVARLLPAGVRVTGGSVRWRGENILRASPRRLAAIRGREISMVFQDSQTSLNPVMRVGSQVREPLLLHGIAGRSKADAEALDWLQRLGIPAPGTAMRRYPHEFSGGMRQRAMIATALIASPALVVADEPTTALDATIQAQIIDVWRRLNRELGVALILVSHDLGIVSETCRRVAVMYAGRIVEIGNVADVLANPCHPYTRALLESMPTERTPRQARLKTIPGEPPAVGRLPPGCPFHPRCPLAIDVCRSREPALATVAGSTVACWVAQAEVPAASAATSIPASAPRLADPAVSDGEQPIVEGEEILRLDHVTHHYLVPSAWPFVPPAHVHALDDVSLSVRRGEVLGVAGESGSGKSTLARCILRLTEVDEGTIVFRGEEITRMRGEALRRVRQHIQPVFQDPYGSLNPRARVRDIVAEPLIAHGFAKDAGLARVEEALDLVGLGAAFADQLPHQLSGGQRQRVGIARAVALRPELIVADEPISALDVSIQAQVINLLRDLQQRFALALVFISHDLRIVRHLSSRVAVMFLGKIVEYGPSELVCDAPQHPYTVALLSSVPAIGGHASRNRIVLAGEPPSPLSPPSGCRFRTRCPYARAICSEVAPEFAPAPDGRYVACHFPGISTALAPAAATAMTVAPV